MIRRDEDIDQKKLATDVLKIAERFCGTADDRVKGKTIEPQMTRQSALEWIAELYMREYWVTSLDKARYEEPSEDFRYHLDSLEMKIIRAASETLWQLQPVYNNKTQKFETVWKMAFPQPKCESEMDGILKQMYVGINPKNLRDHYAGVVDERRFDELLTWLLKDRWTVENFETAFMFFKLWMMNVKMKRFFSPVHEVNKWPKTPIWLSIRSTKHSIGKGFVVGSLRSAFEYLFNSPTKNVTFGDTGKQFKGFGIGNFICHLDEFDRVQKGCWDPNSIKNLISEIKVSIERKGIDNTKDTTNYMSFISTTNQDVRGMVQKVMETDRRFAEIIITDACEDFLKTRIGYDEIMEFCKELWVTCPFEVGPSRLDCKVKDILLAESGKLAEVNFVERLFKIAKQMGWGRMSGEEFKMHDHGIQKVSLRDIEKAHDKEYSFGWSSWKDMAKDRGFMSTYKNGVFKVDFSAVADEVRDYMDNRKDEEDED